MYKLQLLLGEGSFTFLGCILSCCRAVKIRFRVDCAPYAGQTRAAPTIALAKALLMTHD